jgi:hypothetical protein
VEHGLHQFVQLKHSLHVTTENLTSSFISNKGYIDLYKKNSEDSSKIFGLTGTLGSGSEEKLLSEIYKINCAKIPSYKESRLKEDVLVVSSDREWAMKVFIEAIEKIQEERAVLIICKTIQDLLDIKKIFDDAKLPKVKVKTYKDESESRITKDEVSIGDVIIATNISGRGTDLKTNIALEQKGGLHVCIGFLAENQRIEDQALGRTARQGNNGSTKIIVRESELKGMGISSREHPVIKEGRNNLEEKRIDKIKDEIKNIDFKDKLFECFRKEYTKFKGSFKSSGKKFSEYVVRDLEEQWAFWLYNLEKHESKDKFTCNPSAKFAEFKKEAGKTINNFKIICNPYNLISEAESLIDRGEKGDVENALKALEEALTINPDLSAAHQKLFEIHLQSGSVLTERFVKALGQTLGETFCETFGIKYKKNNAYKNNAKESLKKAKAGTIKKEIDYLENKFFTKECHALNTEMLSSEMQQSTKEDLFLKYIVSRYSSLKYFLGDFEKLIGQIDIDKTQKGLVIDTKIDYLKCINEGGEEKLKNLINSRETSELRNECLRDIYLLKEIRDVPENIIKGAQAQIGLGLSALFAGAAFPPILPVMGEIAGILIGEGVSDIVSELLSKEGSDKFNQKEYAKAKVQSYLISFCTMGVSKVVNALKGLKAAQKTFSQVITEIVKDTLKDIAKQAISEKVINPILEEVFDLCKLKEAISEKVNKTISSEIDKDKIQHAKKENIDDISKDILSGDIVFNVILGVAGNLANSKAKAISYFGKSIEIVKCPSKFCEQINERLQNEGENNQIEPILEELSNAVTGSIYSKILGIANDTIFTLPKILKGSRKDDKTEKAIIGVNKNSDDHNKTIIDSYSALGLKQGATIKEVICEYKKLALISHPDKGGSNEAMQKLNIAKDKILSDHKNDDVKMTNTSEQNPNKRLNKQRENKNQKHNVDANKRQKLDGDTHDTKKENNTNQDRFGHSVYQDGDVHMIDTSQNHPLLPTEDREHNVLKNQNPERLSLPINSRGQDCVQVCLSHLPVFNNLNSNNTSDNSYTDDEMLSVAAIAMGGFAQKNKGTNIEHLRNLPYFTHSEPINKEAIHKNHYSNDKMSEQIMSVFREDGSGHCVIVTKEGRVRDLQNDQEFGNINEYLKYEPTVKKVQFSGIEDEHKSKFQEHARNILSEGVHVDSLNKNTDTDMSHIGLFAGGAKKKPLAENTKKVGKKCGTTKEHSESKSQETRPLLLFAKDKKGVEKRGTTKEQLDRVIVAEHKVKEFREKYVAKDKASEQDLETDLQIDKNENITKFKITSKENLRKFIANADRYMERDGEGKLNLGEGKRIAIELARDDLVLIMDSNLYIKSIVYGGIPIDLNDAEARYKSSKYTVQEAMDLLISKSSHPKLYYSKGKPATRDQSIEAVHVCGKVLSEGIRNNEAFIALDLTHERGTKAKLDDILAPTGNQWLVDNTVEDNRNAVLALDKVVDDNEKKKILEEINTQQIKICSEIIYNNPLLNNPSLLKPLLTKYSLSKILDLSSNLDESLINEVLNTNNPDTLLAGLMSVDTSSYDF